MNLDYSARRPRGWCATAIWTLFTVQVLLLDYASGATIRLDVLLVLPIVIATVLSGVRWSLPLALILPTFRFVYRLFWPEVWADEHVVINTLARIGTLVVVVALVDYIQRQRREIETLRGILPICSFCKKIRGTDNQWVPIEHYIAKRSEAKFSHGFCPACGEEHYGELLRRATPP